MSELPFVLRSQYRSTLPSPDDEAAIQSAFEDGVVFGVGWFVTDGKTIRHVPADEPVVKDCLTTADAPRAIPPDELLPGEPGYVEGPVPPSARLGMVVKEPRRFRPTVKNGRKR